MNEYYYDKLLNINTGGNPKELHRSIHYYPYEPTQYSALKILFNNFEVNKTDHVVDYGSGKGRLIFYINYFYQAEGVGIEMDETLHHIAVQNQSSYLIKNSKSTDKINFLCCLAEAYEIKPADNLFYFFNPFSKEIFMTIVNKILISVEHNPREIELILYYASEDYTYFLENDTSFELRKEIRLPAYNHDNYERFLIYHLYQ
ncbi:SAM-dependent methyltransferase [Virgibacillus sp. DJP39]|uniref:SAM-dependent methyltransferase n=1 Tax=Virgibacillus sp. DJP39 TaxID=3409790 RepID=UPI003BB543BF